MLYYFSEFLAALGFVFVSGLIPFFAGNFFRNKWPSFWVRTLLETIVSAMFNFVLFAATLFVVRVVVGKGKGKRVLDELLELPRNSEDLIMVFFLFFLLPLCAILIQEISARKPFLPAAIYSWLVLIAGVGVLWVLISDNAFSLNGLIRETLSISSAALAYTPLCRAVHLWQKKRHDHNLWEAAREPTE